VGVGVGVRVAMGAGYMHRRRGSVLPSLLIALSMGGVVEHLCDRRGRGRADISFRLTSHFVILLAMIYTGR
jgi:hypothetical protein